MFNVQSKTDTPTESQFNLLLIGLAVYPVCIVYNTSHVARKGHVGNCPPKNRRLVPKQIYLTIELDEVKMS